VPEAVHPGGLAAGAGTGTSGLDGLYAPILAVGSSCSSHNAGRPWPMRGGSERAVARQRKPPETAALGPIGLVYSF